MRISKVSVGTIILFVIVTTVLHFSLTFASTQILRDILSPMIGGVIAAFTFCFSFSVLMFNSAIQRFGRESYDLIDKKPLLILIFLFLLSLLSSVSLMASSIDQSNHETLRMGELVVILDSIFLISIVPYFFWLLDRASSVSMLRIILGGLQKAITVSDESKYDLYHRSLLMTAFTITNEHDYASFDYLLNEAQRLYHSLRDFACTTDPESRHGMSDLLWTSFSKSMAMIVLRACERDASYLDDASAFYYEKLLVMFDASAEEGLSTRFSNEVVAFELELVCSLLWFAVTRAYEDKALVGRIYVTNLLQQCLLSKDVIRDKTVSPSSLFDFLYLYAIQHDPPELLVNLFKISVRLYPYAFSLNEEIAFDLRESLDKMLTKMSEGAQEEAKAFMRTQESALPDLSFELQRYLRELLGHLRRRVRSPTA